MSDQTDIIIADPALWRAGDKVTIEGALVDYDLNGALTLGNTGPFVRSAGGTLMFRDETITVTVRRPASPLPDKPGDVFYATVDGEPNTRVTVLALDYFVCVFPSGRYGFRTGGDIDASTVRRVRLVPEDEQHSLRQRTAAQDCGGATTARHIREHGGELMKYTLYVSETVSTAVDIEADTLEDAISEFYQQGLPGLMFLDHTYPDEGEWEVDEESANADYPSTEVEHE